MAVKTFITPFTTGELGRVVISDSNGVAVTFSDPGVYTLTCSVPWGYDDADSLAYADMAESVDAGEGEEFEVTDTPITKYLKITDALPNETAEIVVEYDPAAGGAASAGGVESDADDNTVAGTGAGSTLTEGSGTKNAFFGKDAGSEVTTGDKNVMLGYNAGNGLGNMSGWLAIGSDEAPIDNIYIPSTGAAGPTVQTRMQFGDRIIFASYGTAFTDAELFPGSFTWRLDEAGDKLIFRVKYSDNTLATGEVSLTPDP